MLWEEPPADHHCCTFCPSGVSGLKVNEPASSKEPLRPPFHSLTSTPWMSTTGLPSKSLSSCLARSPQTVTDMLMAESSAIVISRLTSSLPSLDVKEKIGRKLTTTPQRSQAHGKVFSDKVLRSMRPSRLLDKADEMLVRFAEAPDWDHQARTRSASGNFGVMSMAPASINEPLRPPLNSRTMTPLRQMTGLPSKILSSCLARSPHSAMLMLVEVSSATVISRLVRSLPSLEVKETTGLTLVMTPQRSAENGMVLFCSAWRSVNVYFTASIMAMSATSSTWALRSKTIS
mmetsp:Transcript_66553/g.168632  ORF Transcript_66553/g.168632 Transcript_66553/m.168632 type:complete len:289 (+) Transcript_66553:913-1779(+)